MGVDPEHARELALALPAVSEAPHWHRLAFRTPRKIFATLDATARDLNLMFTPDLREPCRAVEGTGAPRTATWRWWMRLPSNRPLWLRTNWPGRRSGEPENLTGDQVGSP